ncbi:MAG: hypothetical protein P8186_30785 [Anaerolineae bacterium]|jgi:O-methyltransferase involved in polyketide biosynthesis
MSLPYLAWYPAYATFRGEGLTFGLEEGQMEEFLIQRGYGQITNVTGEDLRRAYFTGPNQNRRVAPIYAIVHACHNIA